MKKTNVIIAVRDTDLRLSLDLLLREEPELNVVGTATTTGSTLGLIKAESPALILLEWGICNQPIENVIIEIKNSAPGSKVILLGNRMDQRQLAPHVGADAYLLIGGVPESLRSTINDLISKENEEKLKVAFGAGEE
jgi:DNA-binding NarL/FixJ family response regulator